MKNVILILISITALILSVIALAKPTKINSTINPFHKKDDKEEIKIEIADLMLYIQYFHQKIFLASKAGNAKLTKFYLLEMGEKMDEISKEQIWSNGKNISENIRTYALPVINYMLEENPNEVYSNFDNLTQACNNCHLASGHSEIKIKTPLTIEFPNQDFNP